LFSGLATISMAWQISIIGLLALDLVSRKSAGRAAGLPEFFSFFGGAFAANIAIGAVVDHFGWDGGVEGPSRSADPIQVVEELSRLNPQAPQPAPGNRYQVVNEACIIAP